MAFELIIDGLSPLDLNDLRLTRALGGPTQWQFTTFLKSANLNTEQERKLIELFHSEEAVKAKAVWGQSQLCADIKIVGFSRDGYEHPDWHGSPDHLEVFAESTAATGVGVSPFIPRRRVHKADNMLQLFKTFRNIAIVDIERLGDELEEIEFPDNKGRACIIQDGLSDWDFFIAMMSQCRILKPDAEWQPLTITGSVKNGASSGKWVLVSGKAQPYRPWKEVESRRIQFASADGQERFSFGELGSGMKVPEYSSGRYPSISVVRPWRKFDAATWNTWHTRDLPLFIDCQGRDMMVWRVRDRLWRGAHDELAWETFVDCVPNGAGIGYPRLENPLSPWIGCGEVSTADKNEEWMKVKLAGFEKGWDRADVRLSTPFSGKNGKRGLHLVPEATTKVELCWPGRFDTSIVLLGNTRWQSAEFPSPSLFLEDTHKAHYEAVNIAKIGDVSINSALSVGVDETTSLKSQNQLSVKADGADLRMSNGIVYTG